ncbi:Sec7-domain-containing protein [Coniophora puteana RWD-64-598 SS2]|uniref:Sec7-domain-containing protein n=1 Tax=Coniophora puteana (strain RWD-64-598) TaxID=741705 RepID=A0A5M3MSI7_CONPW|nr:Sec7-domain-containing protein [Coniophora puteana RWD-64-598 SS2]EIW82060.1 Sec7-domain-containing protein [Coniophora puteana RWD-64-598 SS2]
MQPASDNGEQHTPTIQEAPSESDVKEETPVVVDGSSEPGQESAADQPQNDATSDAPKDPPEVRDAQTVDAPPAAADTPVEVVSPTDPPSPPPKADSNPQPEPTSTQDVPHESRPSVSSPSPRPSMNGHYRPDVSRPPSQPSTPGAQAHRRSLTMARGQTVSVVLISSALETILSSREAKKSQPLRESAQNALDMVRAGEGGDRPRAIFEPLRLACETRTEKLMIASLDCISKLISYSFFAEPSSAQFLPSPPPSPTQGRPSQTGSQYNAPQPSLVDLVVHTITSCHTEATPETVSLQVVKALLALVLSPTILVHHSSLLKAVRTVYNVFLLSSDPVNQMVAQGGLTQMVHHVFTRCGLNKNTESDELTLKSSTSSEDVSSSASQPPKPDVEPSRPVSMTSSVPTLVAEEVAAGLGQHTGFNPDATDDDVKNNTLEAVHQSTSLETPPPSTSRRLSIDSHVHNLHELSTQDFFVKDAFLVFRALCKLTMKPLNTESERDLKSHAMRSKLLSLHLVLTILHSHMIMFTHPQAIIYSTSSNEATSLVQAINQYLCLSLSRNAVSPVPQVFEVSVEIFWRVLLGMRTKLKKEIEVLLHEIFIPVIEMRTSTLKQKAVILAMFARLCQEPQALVEIYLNYDCDSGATDNIYEHLMNILSKIATLPYAHSQAAANEMNSPRVQPQTKAQRDATPHSSAMLQVPGVIDTSLIGLSEGQLRRQGLECLVSVLRSLVTWGGKTGTESGPGPASRNVEEENPSQEQLAAAASIEALRQQTPDLSDDPSKFESAKQKKTTLLEGIKRFNYKPKRGIQMFIETGWIPSNAPKDIAKFLLTTDGLSKAMIGEYLGEADEENVAVMHALVDYLDFRNLPFLDALRMFLQSFRLPGEAQKIDRFMLKFADRYIAGNIQTPFKNADAAYILAYSVILLNTDAHSPQVKNRMTKLDFRKNNRGINDNEDLPEEFLDTIYDQIQSNEIRMKDEVEAAAPTAAAPGLASALANVGRDLQKEAYLTQSNGMANKTEALFRTLMRSQRKGSRTGAEFFSASHFVHVRPMLEVTWIAFLAGLSGPLQNTDDLETVELCLEGFRHAIHISSLFDLELQRNAFVTTLGKFTFLNNLGEMKTKNMEAIKTLLDIAVNEGNYLKGSWHEVLSCVSQLEQMQLISSGVDLLDAKKGKGRKLPAEELANESRSTHITVAADMVFSLSHYLTGTAIVDFVRALCDVSYEEIKSSGLSQHPRMFSLQKLVEISYYNMNRIRLEWSNLWEILGEHFNQVCTHDNPSVSFFALDSLRQLSMRFLEKEELAHFKFQKDFLKPFEYTMTKNPNPDVRDMVLQCIQQMIQARVQNMRSGWRTMFGVFSAASKVLTERIAASAFEMVNSLNNEHFASIVRHGAFADLTVCITEFCKVSKYQKISLLAIGMLRGVIPAMLSCPDCALSQESDPEGDDNKRDDVMIRFWFPVLFSFYDIIMNGEDIEVRRLALDSLFSTLKTYGATFPVDFWDTVCQELLFPIFAVLKSSQDVSRFSTQEDMSVWLSTTMIQALRDLIDLYTHYYEILERFLDGLLDLLCVCICQENDTLARIGTSCLQQFLENNVSKLSSARWERVASTFVKLFKTTTPHQLFDDSLRVEIDGSSPELPDADANGQAILPAPLSPTAERPPPEVQHSLSDRRRVFKQIIVKCVLQLLLIETTSDLLRNDTIYTTIPPEQLLRLMGVLDHSYQFARMFNDDKELRTGLWKVGFMKHLPNLLKQESSSAATLVHVLLRMYFDERPEHQAARPQIAERLLPLGLSVLQDYIKLRADTQARNIAAWTPVVAEILHGFCRFDNKAFLRYLPAIYPLTTGLLARDVAPEIRLGLKMYFERVGYSQGIIDQVA